MSSAGIKPDGSPPIGAAGAPDDLLHGFATLEADGGFAIVTDVDYDVTLIIT